MAKTSSRKNSSTAKLPRTSKGQMPLFGDRVVVKFRDFVDLPYKDSIARRLDELTLGAWNRLTVEFPGITITTLFNKQAQQHIRILVRKAMERHPTFQAPGFFKCFAVECPPDVDAKAVARKLSGWKKLVERAYVAPLLQTTGYKDNPLFEKQNYLRATDGIDAESLWSAPLPLPGYGGKDIEFVDIEKGWMLDSNNVLNHQDLVAANIRLVSGYVDTDPTTAAASAAHGTRVLGVVMGVNNQIGVIGIASEASARLVGALDFAGKSDFYNAITYAGRS